MPRAAAVIVVLNGSVATGIGSRNEPAIAGPAHVPLPKHVSCSSHSASLVQLLPTNTGYEHEPSLSHTFDVHSLKSSHDKSAQSDAISMVYGVRPAFTMMDMVLLTNDSNELASDRHTVCCTNCKRLVFFLLF